MKLRLAKLFSQGIDYWKLPLSTNEEFLEDVKDLIQTELIADNLMQDLQKKDQLNFVFDTLNIIMQSPAKDKLLKREESIMKTTIPYLIVFKVPLLTRLCKRCATSWTARKKTRWRRINSRPTTSSSRPPC
jgi:hypothetical protein